MFRNLISSLHLFRISLDSCACACTLLWLKCLSSLPSFLYSSPLCLRVGISFSASFVKQINLNSFSLCSESLHASCPSVVLLTLQLSLCWWPKLNSAFLIGAGQGLVSRLILFLLEIPCFMDCCLPHPWLDLMWIVHLLYVPCVNLGRKGW